MRGDESEERKGWERRREERRKDVRDGRERKG